MESHELFRRDGTATGVWQCGICLAPYPDKAVAERCCRCGMCHDVPSHRMDDYRKWYRGTHQEIRPCERCQEKLDATVEILDKFVEWDNEDDGFCRAVGYVRRVEVVVTTPPVQPSLAWTFIEWWRAKHRELRKPAKMCTFTRVGGVSVSVMTDLDPAGSNAQAAHDECVKVALKIAARRRSPDTTAGSHPDGRAFEGGRQQAFMTKIGGIETMLTVTVLGLE